MPIEHDARAAKRVGQNAIRPRLGIPALNRQNLFGMGEIPLLAAVSLFETGEHQLCPHGSVAKEWAFLQCFQ